MKKHIRIISLLFILSILLTGCLNQKTEIKINPDTSGVISLSFIWDEEFITIMESLYGVKLSQGSLDPELSNTLAGKGFKIDKEYTEGRKIDKTAEFSSLEELEEILLDSTEIDGVKLFKQVSASKTEETISVTIVTNKIQNNKSTENIPLSSNSSITLEMNIVLPSSITEYEGGKLQSSNSLNVKITDFSKENRVFIVCDTIEHISTNRLDIHISEENGFVDWIIKEVPDDEAEKANLDNLAATWGFRKLESIENSYAKTFNFLTFDELEEILLSIPIYGNPGFEDKIFKNINITIENMDIKFEAYTNKFNLSEPMTINLLMDENIRELSYGDLEGNKKVSYSSSNFSEDQRLFVRSTISDKSIPNTIKALIIGGVAIAFLLLLNLAFYLIEIYKEKKSFRKKNIEKAEYEEEEEETDLLDDDILNAINSDENEEED